MNKVKKITAAFLSIILIMCIFPFTYANAVSDDLVLFDIKGEVNYDYAYRVVELLNELRRSLNLTPLKMDYELMENAMLRAAESGIYFSHTRPNGDSCFSAITVDYGAAGENIAIGYMSPEHVMEGWRNSEGHYQNMIRSYYETVGIGCFEASDGTLCWVQLFGDNDLNEKTVSGSAEKVYTIEAKTEYLNLTIELDKSCTFKKGDTFKIDLVNYNLDFRYQLQVIESDSLKYVSSNTSVISFSSDGTATVNGAGAADIDIVGKNGGILYSFQYDSGHIYTDCCDTSCDLCLTTRTAPHKQGNTPCNEEQFCERCGVSMGKGSSHKYSGAGDEYCDICNTVRELVYILGDADGDQLLTTGDLAVLKLYLSANVDLESVSKSLSDLNSDNNVDTSDLAQMKLMLAGVNS